MASSIDVDAFEAETTRPDVGSEGRAAPTTAVRDPELAIPSWRPSATLEHSETYGRFEILGRVGRGGMAEILLARERSAAGATRHLVIKRILPEVVEHQDMLEMFLDEARVVMGLSHPNVCQIYEVGSHDGSWYIAMEWVHGITLHELIRRACTRHYVDLNVMSRIIAQCAEALHHAHTARDADGRPLHLVHRDVSPHNIIIGFDGRVKLLDFGIAKTAVSRHVTESGVVKGKVCYMAPEQWLSCAIDGRTDVFALGACLFEALTGTVLFRRESQTEVMRAILQEGAPHIGDVAPFIPLKLGAVVERALARRPSDRFQSGLEMAEALEQYLNEHEEPVTAAKLALYARSLFRSEVEQGPLLERSLRAGMLDRGTRPSFPPPARGLLLPAPPNALDPIVIERGQAALAPMSRIESQPAPVLPAPTPSRLETREAQPAAEGSDTPEESTRRFLRTTPSGEIQARQLARTRPMVAAAMRRAAWVLLPAAAGLLAIVYIVLGATMSQRREAVLLAPQPAAPAAPAVNTRESEARAPNALRSLTDPFTPALLSIDTRPWSTVSIDGQVIGTTPIVDAEVPSGPLTLKLVDANGQVHFRTLAAPRAQQREVFFELKGD